MTPIHRQTLDFISGFIETRGFSPSYQEICNAIGWKSKSRAAEVLNEMRRQGVIDFDGGRKRSITVLQPPAPVVNLTTVRRLALQEAADIAVRFGADGARAAAAIRRHSEAIGAEP